MSRGLDCLHADSNDHLYWLNPGIKVTKKQSLKRCTSIDIYIILYISSQYIYTKYLQFLKLNSPPISDDSHILLFYLLTNVLNWPPKPLSIEKVFLLPISPRLCVCLFYLIFNRHNLIQHKYRALQRLTIHIKL